MFRNYIKTAWRSLRRYKAFSAINILGLALGMTCSLLILLWVNDERSIDGFHTEGKRLFQVYERDYGDGKVSAGYATQGLLAEELKRVIPEIRYSSSLDDAAPPGASNTIAVGEKINKMKGGYASADFFSMFSYPLLEGTKTTALNAPGIIAISRKMAVLFFGGPQQAIGQTILFDTVSLKVSVVFEDMPSRSSLHVEFLRSWVDYVKANAWVHNWGNTNPETFMRLQDGADPEKVQAKIKDFIYRYMPMSPPFRTELALQSYPEKYLHSGFRNGYIEGGRIEYVRIFTIIAVFILLIACINFMNLATAQAARRAREIGVRKVIGAGRVLLIGQFIGEALLLTFLSLLVALLLSATILPAFNDLTGKQLTIPVTNPVFWLTLIGLLFVTGFVAGSYPAFFLSSLDPIKVLKGSLKFGWREILARRGLVVFQFSLTLLLIVGMIVIYRQLNYIQTMNIGYDRENLIYVPIEGEMADKYPLFKEEAGKIPGITGMSKMRNSPTVIIHHTGSIDWPGQDPNVGIHFADEVVGYDFVKTLGLQLKEGRDFSKDYPTDSTGYLLNETAVNKMGLADPIGQTIVWGRHSGKVIGVLKDFHFNSMHSVIDPLIVRLDEHWTWGNILVRVQAGKAREALSGLEKLAKTLNPKFPFTYTFSDQEFAKLYKSEQLVSKLSNYFACLGIFISCLGLFGLATFATAQRRKEIGVRKVLGASVTSISILLANDFLKVVALAMLAAFPAAWLVMNKWLQNFVYRIDIEWWMFALAGFVTLGIAMLTVSYQSIRSALANPVKSLRTE
ncbi:MAG TPA: ABC transporter permease [Puia sp.]|jgi:ABC-type antimicrobial peptide transport system permease subunit